MGSNPAFHIKRDNRRAHIKTYNFASPQHLNVHECSVKQLGREMVGVLKLVLPIQIVQNFDGRVLHICASVSPKHRHDIISDIQSLFSSDHINPVRRFPLLQCNY